MARNPTHLAHVDDKAFRAEIQSLIQKSVRMQTGVGPDRAFAQGLFEALVETIFVWAGKTGYARLPKGWGVFTLLKKKGQRMKKLPTGQVVENTGAGYAMKYREGAATRELLGKEDRFKSRVNARSSSVEDFLLMMKDREIQRKTKGVVVTGDAEDFR